ncbi:MAG: hypothetical protein ACRCT8_02095 [Lacipirellulaceae bacterium]
MFSVYDKSGLHLAYPENWTLDESTDSGARVELTLSSPNTAFLTLAHYPGLLDLEGLADQALAALRGEYPDLESSPASESFGETPLLGYDVNFICLDLINTALVRTGHFGAGTLLVLAQAEDRELPVAEQVFRAILTSLLAAPAPK